MKQWQSLVDALRAEIEEYGALRALLDAQRKAIFVHDSVAVAECSEALKYQIDAAASLRLKREALVRNFALEYALEGKATLRNLFSVFPVAAHPLLNALADEVASMTSTLKKRSDENQSLMARTLDALQKSLERMRSSAFDQAYASRGARALEWGSKKSAA